MVIIQINYLTTELGVWETMRFMSKSKKIVLHIQKWKKHFLHIFLIYNGQNNLVSRKLLHSVQYNWLVCVNNKHSSIGRSLGSREVRGGIIIMITITRVSDAYHHLPWSIACRNFTGSIGVKMGCRVSCRVCVAR